jgi:hypothetical protein
MIETMGKRLRKPPIQCWGCGEYHIYIDFPHMGEKVRTVHNAQQTTTVEDMGRNVPRIYAALDNKKVEFQSHMIEVEGKINDQPIAILINSGASHSYLDPKMVEIFKLTRRNLGKPWLVRLATIKRKLMRWLRHVQWI